MPTHLNPGLAEPQPVAELLPHESVWVVRLVKQPLQLVQLLQREVGPGGCSHMTFELGGEERVARLVTRV